MDSKVCTRCGIGTENYHEEPVTSPIYGKPLLPLVLCDECCRKLVTHLRARLLITRDMLEHFTEIGD